MTKLLWGLALIALLSLGWGVWRDHEASGWEKERVGILAESRLLRATADSLRGEAEKSWRAAQVAIERANAYRDAVRPPNPHPPDTTQADSVRFWRATAEVAEQDAVYAHLEAQTLRGALDSAQASIVRLKSTSLILEARGDSLASVLARAPNPCPKIPLLGIPLPKVGIGYAVTTGGQGLGVALVVPLGCR